MAITKTMTEGAPWKHILRFSLPVLAESLLQQLYNTVDRLSDYKWDIERIKATIRIGFPISLQLIIVSFGLTFGVFQGTGHSGIPTIVATCALGIRVVVTYLFRYSDIFGHTIIWWNGIFGFGLGFMITWSYYLSGRWKNSRIW